MYNFEISFSSCVASSSALKARFLSTGVLSVHHLNDVIMQRVEIYEQEELFMLDCTEIDLKEIIVLFKVDVLSKPIVLETDCEETAC